MIEIYKSVGRKKRWFESKAQMKKFWEGSKTDSLWSGDSKYYQVKVFKLVWTKSGNVWKEIDPTNENE